MTDSERTPRTTAPTPEQRRVMAMMQALEPGREFPFPPAQEWCLSVLARAEVAALPERDRMALAAAIQAVGLPMQYVHRIIDAYDTAIEVAEEDAAARAALTAPTTSEGE